MGMAASQARLIALTARMADVEYEGQQINQQRLTLSNKMNEVYAAMCNMDVPTPPSKIDFATDKYQGNMNGCGISVRNDENGNPKAYKEVTGPIVEESKGTKGGHPTVKLSDKNFNTIADGSEDGKYNEVKDGQDADLYINKYMGYTSKDFTEFDLSKLQRIVTKEDNIKTEWEGAKVYCQGQYYVKFVTGYTGDIGEVVYGEPQSVDFNDVNRENVLNPDDNYSKDGKEGKVVSVTSSIQYCTGNMPVKGEADIVNNGNYINPETGETYKGSDILAYINGVNANNNKSFVVADGDGFKNYDGELPPAEGVILYECMDKAAYEKASKDGTIADIDFFKPYSDGKLSPLTGDINDYFVVTGAGECKPLSTFPDLFYNDGENYYINLSKLGDLKIKIKDDASGSEYLDTHSVGTAVTNAYGQTGSTMSIDEAMSTYGDKFNTAWSALQHSFPDMNDAELKNMFSVVDFGKGSKFAFVYTENLLDNGLDISIFDVTTGKYEQEMDESTYKLTYDAHGNLTGLKTTNGQATSLHPVQAYDELAYDEAMATYEAEKILYDKEQNRLNQQTSVYARQDKQLELKLTRLDTERNALNTELEAVKKVIQDAVEKGFKTFSG